MRDGRSYGLLGRCLRLLSGACIMMVWSAPLWAEHYAPVDDLSAGPAFAKHAAPGAQARDDSMLPAKIRALVEMDLPMQISQMRQQLSALQGQLEQAQHEMADLKRQLRSLLQGDAGVKAQRSPASPAVTSEAPQVEAKAPPRVLSEAELYEAALTQLQRRDYDASMQSFKRYLTQYPQGKYRPNVYYWLGEIGLVRGESQAAIRDFDKVVQQYPLSPKAPDALLKKGMALQQMGQTDDAERLFRSVVTQFPASSAAQYAQQLLDKAAEMA